MFVSYEANVNATIAFLKALNVKVSNKTVNDSLHNHPEWPSLLCISDSLTKWNIPNSANSLTSDYLDQIPTPFIAYTLDKEKPLAIVTKIVDDLIYIKQKNYKKETIIERKEFLKTWQNIYLIAEPNEKSGEINYYKKKRRDIINFLLPITILILFILVSVFLLSAHSIGLANNLKTALIIQFTISFLGLILSSLLLWYEIDKNNPLLQKVCTGFTKTNCNSILTGKGAKIWGISWSEIGFYYFSGATISLQLFGTSLLPIVAFLNILAIIYPFFSIYYQWRVAKQWCILCLSVQLLLILGVLNVLFFYSYKIVISDKPLEYLKIIVVYSLPLVIWFFLKPYFLRLQKAKTIKSEFLRTKFNIDIFTTLLLKQKKIDSPLENIGIVLGNPTAENTIVKVCNPYCTPCMKAHPKLENLLKNHSNLKLRIIFNTANDSNSYDFPITNHLMAIASTNNTTIIKSALNFWYNLKEKNYDEFSLQYSLNQYPSATMTQIETMYKWCVDMKIQFTPTYFFNGYQLPDVYDIEDLHYFLLDY